MNYLAITQELLSSQIVQRSAFLTEICAANINLYPQGVPALPWAGYLTEKDGVIVGTCAYKSAPMAGAVEIAYCTLPEYEGRGIATRMAQHLVELAAQHGVAIVRAQTLPETNASTHILTKLGFRLVGPVQHPEDGEVWEWHKSQR